MFKKLYKKIYNEYMAWKIAIILKKKWKKLGIM